MLHVIEGPAGSGKTTKAYELLLEGAARNKDKNYILVIPEQSSISAQKDIIDKSPNNGILNIDILSFNRLAHRIFEAVGGEACELIDDSGKNLIIRHIADDIIDELSVIRGELKKSGYVAEIRSVISELMQYGIGPDDIPEIAEHTAASSPYLSRKLKDVALIYRKFREYMGNEFMTREELLVKASAEVKKAAFLNDSVLIFDSFTGFTPVQYMFMEALLTRCRDIYICLTRSDTDRGNLFSLGDTSRERLESIAERHGGIDEIRLAGDRRHKTTSDINAVGTDIFSLARTDREDRDGSVLFHTADDPYEEVRFVLQGIADLVRDKGFHYRDCGILMGETSVYADIVRSEAARYRIPVYVDQTRHIGLNPFTELIRAVILILKENYSYSSVFHLLRTGLTGIKTDDIDNAENYILATGIKGAPAYDKPFEAVFKGASESARDAAERVRIALNELLKPVRQAASDKSCLRTGDMIAAVRELCALLGVEEKLSDYVTYFRENGDPEREIEYSQIYDILNRQFENMDSLIGDQRVSIQEFSELYEDALSEIRVGVIPPKADVVMAGDLTRSRFSHLKALFFIGMTEGAIPVSGSKGGLISDNDRRVLQSVGVEVAPTAAENAEKEKFYFYLNLMKPEELVSFSFPADSLDGVSCRESYFMKEARRCLKVQDCQKIKFNHKRFYSKDDLLGVFSEKLEADDHDAAKSLKALEELGDSTDEKAVRLSDALIRKEDTEEKLSREAGIILFGESFIESPTELERFAACPYSHFLGYGLRLKERAEFEFEKRDMGSMLHKILELFSRKLAEESLTFRNVGDERAKILLEKAIEEASDETVYGRIAALVSSGARNVHALERLKSYASRSIDTLRYQSRQGSFDSIYFERKFSHAGLKGTIDRCDEAVTPEGLFLDVIDYKSGNKSFDPDRIYYGLDIQLPLYMNAALQMRAASSGGRIVRPAGLFYYHVDDPVIEGARGSTEEEITEGIRKELRLRGVVNSDIAAVKAFDSEIAERGRSVVIPVGFKKDGGYEAAAKVYTEAELFSLMDHSIKLTKELREEITGGNVSRSPYSLGNITGCDYCAYRDICDGGRLRRLAKHDFPAAWNTQKPE
ncbi:MAG: PD-(D/E)XK nuclease family protein [Lachnospiraceae bacterium]|nr:PD-(D/E)XK nuclease family protein [Lachnospiraceae bacterium]